MVTLGRKSRGRQKIVLERMEKKSNRLVTFSKRRGGVFKKASELCTLCGVQALCIVFSPAKKAFAFGHPSVEAVINRFLLEDNNLPQDNRVSTKNFQKETLLRSNKKVSLLKDQIEIEKKRGEELIKERKLMSEEAQKFLAPAETLTLPELKQMQATLIALKNNVLAHRHNLVQAQPNLNLGPNPNPSILHGQNSLEQNPFLNPPNMLVGQYYTPNPTLVQGHTPPAFGDPSHMTMVPPLMVNENTPVDQSALNAGFTNSNIPPYLQGPTNLIPGSGSFNSQNNMLTDMGWNPMQGQTFTNLLTGEGGSNSSAPPFNPQDRYMGSNPIPGDYNTFQNLLNSAPPCNPRGEYMGNNPVPGDQTYRNLLMGEGSSNPSIPPFNPQDGFGFGFDPGMN